MKEFVGCRIFIKTSRFENGETHVKYEFNEYFNDISKGLSLMVPQTGLLIIIVMMKGD